jgi:hypothetical protein
MMFSTIRKRITYTNLALTLALVFAMTGGAYAASKYLITSTKQISPKVLKALTGKTGAAGTNGAQGPAGGTGPQGPAGAAGPQGTAGTAGTPGTPGKPGTNGTNGAPGSPWTAGGTLPAGATLKGEWNLNGQVSGGLLRVASSVSFGIPLAAAATIHYIKPLGTTPAGCTGDVTNPGATEGVLCVFAKQEENSEPTFFGSPLPAVCGWETVCPSATSSLLGFAMYTFSHEAGEVNLNGTWAVTG